MAGCLLCLPGEEVAQDGLWEEDKPAEDDTIQVTLNRNVVHHPER